MYHVYILKSIASGHHYIGHTNDLVERIERHNGGRVHSTKNGRPWKIVLTEKYETKSEAAKREMEIKKYKGGILFKRLIGLWKD
jgi:putative endonuclease